jgi:hypothetical protein
VREHNAGESGGVVAGPGITGAWVLGLGGHRYCIKIATEHRDRAEKYPVTPVPREISRLLLDFETIEALKKNPRI